MDNAKRPSAKTSASLRAAEISSESRDLASIEKPLSRRRLISTSSFFSEVGEVLAARDRSLERAFARSTTASSENWLFLPNRKTSQIDPTERPYREVINRAYKWTLNQGTFQAQFAGNIPQPFDSRRSEIAAAGTTTVNTQPD